MVLSVKEAIKEYYVELLDKLPLDDEKFFGMVKGADLFPLDTGDNIKAKPTRAEKVAYFLQHVIEPGADLYLPRLLTVMKESKVIVLIKLAEDIGVAAGLDQVSSSGSTKHLGVSGNVPSSSDNAHDDTAIVNMQSSSTKIKLFISYAWEKATNDFVVKLKGDLEAKGLQIFLDKHDILPGDDIQKELAKGIDEADGIVIVYSEKYRDSRWCSRELQMAQNLDKKFFPVRRIKDPYPGDVNLSLGGILYVNFTLENEVEYQRSLASLIKGIEKK